MARISCFIPVRNIGVMVLSLWSACAGAQPGTVKPADKVIDVRIENLKFVPQNLTVVPGATVRWTNIDPVDHDVTSGTSINGRQARGLAKTKFPDDLFASGLFARHRSFSVTFEKPGIYNYYCNIHPFMTGKITVK